MNAEVEAAAKVYLFLKANKKMLLTPWGFGMFVRCKKILEESRRVLDIVLNINKKEERYIVKTESGIWDMGLLSETWNGEFPRKISGGSK